MASALRRVRPGVGRTVTDQQLLPATWQSPPLNTVPRDRLVAPLASAVD